MQMDGTRRHHMNELIQTEKKEHGTYIKVDTSSIANAYVSIVHYSLEAK